MTTRVLDESITVWRDARRGTWLGGVAWYGKRPLVERTRCSDAEQDARRYYAEHRREMLAAHGRGPL